MSSGFDVKRDVKATDKQISVEELGRKLCKLFHLPKNTTSFELKVEYAKPIIIKCEYYPEDKDLQGIELVTAEFELIERTHAVDN